MAVGLDRHFFPQRLLDCFAGQRERGGEEMHGNPLRPRHPDGDVPRLEACLVRLGGPVRVTGLAPALASGFSDGLADDDRGLVGGHWLVVVIQIGLFSWFPALQSRRI